MSEINYVRGDATAPQADGNKIIVHVLSDRGKWGKGFVLAVSKRWAAPREQFLQWHAGRGDNDFALGAVQFVRVGDDLWVANLVGQHGVTKTKEGPPIRYPAVEAGLARAADKAAELGASVHMPRIGCGLAGGQWEHIEPLIRRQLCDRDIPVTVYDFG